MQNAHKFLLVLQNKKTEIMWFFFNKEILINPETIRR